MVDENSLEQPQEKDDLFGQLSEIRPARSDVAVKEGDMRETGEDGGGSLTQRMRMSPKMSDTQLVDKRLFPVLKDNVEWLNNLMVARVFPETLNPLRNIITKHLLQEYPEMSMAESICLAEVALTVAIDGEGRMDIIHLFSKMSDPSDDEKKGKLV